MNFGESADASPHTLILVVAGCKRCYEAWLRENRLNPKSYHYAYSADDFRGRNWDSCYVLLTNTWYQHQMFNYPGYAREILDRNFPGWHPEEVIWGEAKNYS